MECIKSCVHKISIAADSFDKESAFLFLKIYLMTNQDLLAIAKEFGTPVYVYDVNSIREQYEKLTSSFSKNTRFFYAAKALTNINILKYVEKLGASLDCVSINEVKLGLKAGFSNDRILFTPNCVDLAEIEEAMSLNVHINIDNISILEQFGNKFGGSYPIFVRINPHIFAGGNYKISTGHIDSKFGISIHQLLSEKLSSYKAGASGLLALDWFNGVRTPLMDFNLNGLIMGMNLLTKPEEIYLSLIEATAYGTRMIIEGFEEAGLEVKDITLSGGIPIKNEMLVQVYSDVCNRKIKVVDSTQSSALGAAILGAAAAPERITGFKNANEAAKKLGKVKDKVWEPNQDNVEIYNELYEEYKTLHGYFGTGINDVMKHLNNIRERRK